MKHALAVSILGLAASSMAATGGAFSSRNINHSGSHPKQVEPLDAGAGPWPLLVAANGDAEYGAYLSSECTSCHRSDGENDGIPSITGWPEEDFIAVLDAYRAKERENQAMQLVASRLTDEEIAALAAYFAQAADGNR